MNVFVIFLAFFGIFIMNSTRGKFEKNLFNFHSFEHVISYTVSGLKCYDCSQVSGEGCETLAAAYKIDCGQTPDYEIIQTRNHPEKVRKVCIKTVKPYLNDTGRSGHYVRRFCGTAGPPAQDDCARFHKDFQGNYSCFACDDEDYCNSSWSYHLNCIQMTLILCLCLIVNIFV
jgi:hypothetical protein